MKITLSDLTNEDIPVEPTPADFIAHEIDTSLSTNKKRQKPTIQFLDLKPQNDLERVLLKKELKSAVSGKNLREKLIKIRFDAKMQRIKKIKSKKYRKQRRRVEAKKALEEKLNVDQESSDHDEDSVSDEISFEDDKNVEKLLGIIKGGSDPKQKNQTQKSSPDGESLHSTLNQDISDRSACLDMKSSSNPTARIFEDISSDSDEGPVAVTNNDSSFVKNLLNRKRELAKPINTHIHDFKGNNKSIQTDLVKSLFQDIAEVDNDFTNDFYSVKKDKLDHTLQDDEEIVLHGWGQWGGTGVQTIKTKYNTIILKNNSHNIDERELKSKHVIFNASVPAPDKYLSDLPRHMTRESYLKRMRTPVSREMNSAQMFLRYVKNKDAGPDEFYEYASKHKQ